MNRTLYEYILQENVELLKAIYNSKIEDNKKELLLRLKDNLEYIKLLEVKMQNESGVKYGR